MKILVIGDVFGDVGLKMIREHLPELKKKYQIDLAIVNAENATNGRGISFLHYKQIKEYGAEIITSGNHIFDKEETLEYIKKTNDLLRPINSNPYHPGLGTTTIKIKDKIVRVSCLLGTTFINPPGENPFFALEKIIKNKEQENIHLVDFHAQATAEKKALAIHFDGLITAFWGTHTHVQTADEEIMPKGTAYITDVGMTGPAQGVIGAEPQAVIKRIKYSLPIRITPHKGKGQLNGIVINIDEKTNQATKIERIFLKE